MNGRRPPTFIGSAVLVLVAGSCTILGLADERRLGLIEFYGDTAEISVPGVVGAGASFTVAFNTFGGGCVSRGGTRVDVVGSTAIVTPFDTHSGADICTAELRYLDHTTSVRMDKPGSGVVIVRGRVEPGDEVVERTFPVVVE